MNNEPDVDDIKDVRHRVKLYVLNEKRVWEDRGTGHVSWEHSDSDSNTSNDCFSPSLPLLMVRSENDGHTLLESKILTDTAYQKQQETLIVWSEGDNCDLALSFQEKSGCDEIWEKICQVQGKDPSVEVTQDVEGNGESDSESCGDQPDPASISSPHGSLQLPAAELSRLADISDLFTQCMQSPVKRENLALSLESENYVKKLLDIFHVCEDLENSESLHQLYNIFKHIFLLNKNALFEILFSEEHIKDVVGVLEHDPSSTSPKRHRQYLWEQARFNEVIPISSADLKAKIHQTYRVQYIQDIIAPAPSVFEDNLLSTLNSFIFFNKVEIVSLIQDDESFLKQLFDRLKDENTPGTQRRDLAMFLREFCTFSQTLQPQARETFFRTVSNHGILPAIEMCLSADEEDTRLAAIDIFANVIEYSPSMVREYILQQQYAHIDDDQQLFMNTIIEQMCCDKDPELGGGVQLMGILRVLIDPENMMASAVNKTEKTDFLNFFYKRCMANLCAPLLANTTDSKPANDDYHTAHLLSLLLELLTFCVEHHTYNIRNYILSKDLLRRVLVLLCSRHSFLTLCALRFLRRIVSLKDEFYNRYIVRNKLLGPVVNFYMQNGHKYNLVNSALLELFEFIRSEDIKTLCIYFAENYIDQFKEVDYVHTFQALKLRYEQQLERPSAANERSSSSFPFRSPTLGTAASRWRRDPREMDEDEEAYFNEEDEEEWEENVSGSSPINVDSPKVPLGTSQSISNTSPLIRSPVNSSSPTPGSPRPQMGTSSPLISFFRGKEEERRKGKENVPTSPTVSTIITSERVSSPRAPGLPQSTSESSQVPLQTVSTGRISPSSPVQQLLATKGGLVDYDEDSEEESSEDSEASSTDYDDSSASSSSSSASTSPCLSASASAVCASDSSEATPAVFVTSSSLDDRPLSCDASSSISISCRSASQSRKRQTPSNSEQPLVSECDSSSVGDDLSVTAASKKVKLESDSRISTASEVHSTQQDNGKS